MDPGFYLPEQDEDGETRTHRALGGKSLPMRNFLVSDPRGDYGPDGFVDIVSVREASWFATFLALEAVAHSIP